MTAISIDVEDELYARFKGVCDGLGVDPVAYIEDHARDAIKTKLADLAGEFISLKVE